MSSQWNNVSSINYIVDVYTKEGQTYVLEIKNRLDSRKNMENIFIFIIQARLDDMIIEYISP